MRYLLSVVVVLAGALIVAAPSASAQSATEPAGRLEACLMKDSPAIQQNPAAWHKLCLTMYKGNVEKRGVAEAWARERQAIFDRLVVHISPEAARAGLRAGIVEHLRTLGPTESGDIFHAVEQADLIRELAAIDALVPTPPDWFEANAPAAATAPPPVREIVREVVQPVFLPPLPRFELPQMKPYFLQPYIMQPVRPPLNVTCTSYRYGTMIETRCQ